MSGRTPSLWSREAAGWKEQSQAALLSSLACLYGTGVALRSRAFERGWKSIARAGVPVISIGNLSAGGTGKTPCTLAIAEELAKKWKVAILSRGYGRKGEGVVLLLPHTAAPPDPLEMGDEPSLMAARLPQAAFGIGAKRVETWEQLRKLVIVDVILLDDGFQHRAMGRDFDVVCVDGIMPFGNGRLLPRGPLREPAGALRRAQAACFKGLPGQDIPATAIAAVEAAAPELPLFRMSLEPAGWYPWKGFGTPPALQPHPPEGKGWAFAGLASPVSFEATCRTSGCILVGNTWFPDHHILSLNEWLALMAEVPQKATYLVTTEKDAVKIPASWIDQALPLYVLRVEAHFSPMRPEGPDLFSLLRTTIEEFRC